MYHDTEHSGRLFRLTGSPVCGSHTQGTWLSLPSPIAVVVLRDYLQELTSRHLKSWIAHDGGPPRPRPCLQARTCRHPEGGPPAPRRQGRDRHPMLRGCLTLRLMSSSTCDEGPAANNTHPQSWIPTTVDHMKFAGRKRPYPMIKKLDGTRAQLTFIKILLRKRLSV